jgi:hypothetical protein
VTVVTLARSDAFGAARDPRVRGVTDLSVPGMTDDQFAKWRAMTPAEHVVAHLGWTLLSVRDLLRYASDEAEWETDFTVAAGCRDAFYMHVRTVAEFFVRFPRGDWTARDYLPSWTPPSDLAARLDAQWWIATKHITHMSRKRVPAVDNFVRSDTSLVGLTAIAMDCYRVMATFVKAYQEQPDSTHAKAMGDVLRGTTSTESWFADILVLPPHTD